MLANTILSFTYGALTVTKLPRLALSFSPLRASIPFPDLKYP